MCLIILSRVDRVVWNSATGRIMLGDLDVMNLANPADVAAHGSADGNPRASESVSPVPLPQPQPAAADDAPAQEWPEDADDDPVPNWPEDADDDPVDY